MTKDQIDELMRENGIVIVGEAVYALCNLVEEQSATAEREACARVAESYEPRCDICPSGVSNAIRARREQ